MFKNILVPLHLSYKENHKKLFEGALNVLDEDGKMTLFYVNENLIHGSVQSILEETQSKNANQLALEELKAIAQKHALPLDKVTFKIKEGVAHREILQSAQKMKADAIVMMATKPGLGSYFISSTAERVIRHANCSVFVIRLTEY